MTAIALQVPASSRPWAAESPVSITEGDVINFNFNIAYATSVANDGSLGCILYKDGKATAFLTGSVTATGADNNISSKTLNAIPKGDYVLEVTAKVDGLVRVAGCVELLVRQHGQEQ